MVYFVCSLVSRINDCLPMNFVLLIILTVGIFFGLRLWGDAARRKVSEGAVAEAFSQDRLMSHVERYDGLGLKRTGMPGDLATTAWLEAELDALGFTTRRQAFTIESFIVERAEVRLPDREIEAFPQFPVTATTADGVRAPLVLWSAESDEDVTGKIVLVDIAADRRHSSVCQDWLSAPIQAAAESGAVAVILLIRTPGGTVKMLNAPVEMEPWPVPVLHVGEKDVDCLFDAIKAKTEVCVRIDGQAKQVEAFNLIAQIGPADRDPIVVTTPQSGWFHAAAERGSGIAVFLALAQWAAGRSGRHFIFAANSGHEREDFGAGEFAREKAPPPEKTVFWLHIGANVGAWHMEADSGPNRSRYLMTNWTGLPRAWRLFRNQPGLDRPLPLELGKAKGELRVYYDAGYRPLLGIFGSAPYHHCPDDRIDKVSIEAVQDVAVSCAALINHVA